VFVAVEPQRALFFYINEPGRVCIGLFIYSCDSFGLMACFGGIHFSVHFHTRFDLEFLIQKVSVWVVLGHLANLGPVNFEASVAFGPNSSCVLYQLSLLG